MALIIFRELPAVAGIERQLELYARDRLHDDEIEELPHLIDAASIALFGITYSDTYYHALPEAVRGRYDRREWEDQFEILGRYSRDPNTLWSGFGLDLCCAEGRSLHCVEMFGRQLICALHGLHPQAMLRFADREIARAA